MSSTQKNYVSLSLVFVISLTMFLMDVETWLVFVTIFGVVLFGFIPTVYTILWTTNVNRIEKYLLNEKQNVDIYLIYALGNQHDDEVKRCIEQILHKHKQPDRQALYKVLHALYKKEILTAADEIEYIKPLVYKQYYKSIMLIEQGQFDAASRLIEQISKPWMKYALLSELELRQHNREQALHFAKVALDRVRGLQRYVMYKSYQRDFPELFFT
ncbi:hypothetical protein [Paenibacillus sp. 481]|uniref:hypothetical protein n=1 Tax=Paenibacillus sp. 481 TaxID=2835869 RepID=UPI001E63B94B|nr:hypothetical protein [Paenibacillus sp. 481]UHA73665.1 hypothetical protein KIK04_00340 [Paenibacillus sp. 481]